MARRRKRNRSLIRQLLNPWRIAIPVVIGLGVSVWQISQELNGEHLQNIDWGGHLLGFVLLSFGMMLLRDAAYIYRIKLLSDGALSWRKAIDVILLWEFASAITPSVVGGAPIAVMIINREGVSFGKSTAMVMVTALMDELFFVLMVPVLYFAADQSALFPVETFQIGQAGIKASTALWLSYGLIALYCVFISSAIFVAPRKVKRGLIRLFSVGPLLRWRKAASRFGADLELASNNFKGRSIGFWLKTFGATYLSWTGRYLVINCLIGAVTIAPDQVLIYARQLVMWVILLISVTPGGSGFAEVVFDQFFQDMIPPGLTSSVGAGWRLISYWAYIVIGILILPAWLRRVYLKRKLIRFKS